MDGWLDGAVDGAVQCSSVVQCSAVELSEIPLRLTK